VAYTDVGTPLSNDFYLGSVRGEVYALENTADRYGGLDALLAQHPTSTVPGLLLTGQDACCVGVVSAMVSGLLTAANVSYVAALRCVLEIVLAV
jgi:all-trans-retinol 13,14-reductase